MSSIIVLSASGTEPMYWSSFMTSSMQLAKECLSQKLTDDIGETFQPFEGLEKFAETIETGIVIYNYIILCVYMVYWVNIIRYFDFDPCFSFKKS